MNERTYKAYVQILEDELIVATGCTEPIAIAFAAAKAAQVLGSEPERISISVSGNIIKNVHSVTVPNTGGQHGVKTAVAAGIAAGDADKGLDVLSGLNDDGRVYMARYLEEHEIRVEFADTSEPFYIDVRMFGGNGGSARVVMAKNHTNVVLVERDGEILQDTRTEDPSDGENALTELLNVADIIEFADTVDLADVEEVLSRQAEYNYAISCEGLKNDWGGRVGKLYASDAYPDDLLTQAKAAAAAGSDARMGGCPMPVVIVSGSGNQGITASVPIVVYARALDIPREKMLRALAVSDLISIYQKSGIGCLSAFCGAVSAAPAQHAASPISSAGAWRKSSTRSSIRSERCRAWSATARSLPAPPRLQWPSSRACSGIACSRMETSSTRAMESSPWASTRPSAT